MSAIKHPIIIKNPDNINPLNTLNGLSAAQLRHAYRVDTIDSQGGSNGTAQVVVIIVAFHHPNLQSDFNHYCTVSGLPTAEVQQISVGSTTPSVNVNWSWEESLDLQCIHAIAPMAKKLIIEADSDSTNDLYAAVQKAIDVASPNDRKTVRQFNMSWGGIESPFLNYDYMFNQTGFSFVASSGDNGMECLYPATCPYVVSVGGTTLSVDENYNRVSESGWSGSGGGVSTIKAKPPYQKGFVSRFIGRLSTPDISASANPNPGFRVYNSLGGGWGIVGGTSWAAPFVTGLITLANDKRYRSGRTPLGTGYQYGTPEVLYKIAGENKYTNPQNAYFDISTGNNGVPAAPGFDNVTGLGTPNAPIFVNSLVLS